MIKDTEKPEEQPLRIAISNSRIIISVGINRLNGNDHHPDIPEFVIKDIRQWGEDVASELERERTEQGNTLLCDMLDRAIVEAIEMGSNAVVAKKGKSRCVFCKNEEGCDNSSVDTIYCNQFEG